MTKSIKLALALLCGVAALTSGAQYAAKQTPLRTTKARPTALSTLPMQQTQTKMKPSRIPEPRVKSALNQFTKGLHADARSSRTPLSPQKIRLAENSDSEWPEIIGSVVYAEGWNDYTAPVGLYSIPTSEQESFELKFTGPDAQSGGVLVDNVYYVCERLSFSGSDYTYFVAYDMTDGEILYEHSYPYHTFSMTYDVTTSRVYGITVIEDAFYLTIVNFHDQTVDFEPIAPLNPEGTGIWNSIACDGNGQLYGIYGHIIINGSSFTCTGSSLYKIDKETADVTLVGDTGYDCTYASDATFDTRTNRMLWTVSPANGTGFLAEVNTSTGEATPIYVFPLDQEVVGLAVPLPIAEPEAPGAASELRADFSGKSLTGTLSFHTPATLYNGAAPSGQLSYEVSVDGMTLATGVAGYDETVSAQVTVSSPGFYTFVVTTSNDAGVSPKAEISAYVGSDTPEATTVTVEYTDGIMNVSWLPVTSTLNGGYLDVDNVTYTVTRFPGEVIVAENISECHFNEPIPEPENITSYCYEVVAQADGLASAPARSNYVILGSIVPPYVATFDESSEGFLALDENRDGRTWMNIHEMMRIQWNSSMAMDDWLLAPPMRLEKGKYYEIACQLGVESPNFPERVEIKIGRGSNPDQMNITLLEPTVLTNVMEEDPWNWSSSFIPDEDGIYFLGIHGISDADSYYLFVDNFSITAPMSVSGPAAVSNLNVVPGEDGALSADISFITPDKTLTGADLSSLSKIELSRNGELIKTWTNPAVGVELTYADEVPELGDYIYTVVTFNEDGNGGEAVASVFIGVDYPAAITGVHAFETANPGEVTITWDAVESSANGEPMAPWLVKYQVFRAKQGQRIPVSGEISGNSFTYQAIAAGEQDFVQFVVVPFTDRGEGESDMTEFFPAGTPYSQYILSSAADMNRYTCGVSGMGGGSWGSLNDEYFGNVSSQDNDNFFFAMVGQFPECWGDFYTGLVKLDMADPGFTFYTFNLAFEDGSADENNIEIYIKEKGADSFTLIKDIIVGETGASGRWNRVYTDLSDYAGKVVQLCIRPYVRNSGYTFIDNIRINSVPAHDMGVESVTAPAQTMVGYKFPVGVSVINAGSQSASDYTIELYVDDILTASCAGQELAAGFSYQTQFEVTLSPLTEEDVQIYAKVVYASDQDDSNDTLAVDVYPLESNLPKPENLQAQSSDNCAELTWETPDIERVPGEPITEDFEDGDAFSNEYGDWIFVDVDEKPVGGFSDIEVPGIMPGVTTGAFWIWDQSTLGNSTFAAHSGTKYLFALYANDDTQTDDWAISPELDGSFQTISFYAKSYQATYPEEIEIYYSDGSIDPTEFVKIEGAGGRVGGEWTLYEVNIPAGAGRFAIRSCAVGSFMLMIDDVTYIPAGSQSNVSLKGYNVYRDGEKLNTSLITDCRYTDNEVVNGNTYHYLVTALYTSGESSPSNEVEIMIDGSGVEQLTQGIRIYSDEGLIIVSGAEGRKVTISTPDGKLLYNATALSTLRIPAPKGIYLITAGPRTTTLIVK